VTEQTLEKWEWDDYGDGWVSILERNERKTLLAKIFTPEKSTLL